jgi:hypothetical protein
MIYAVTGRGGQVRRVDLPLLRRQLAWAYRGRLVRHVIAQGDEFGPHEPIRPVRADLFELVVRANELLPRSLRTPVPSQPSAIRHRVRGAAGEECLASEHQPSRDRALGVRRCDRRHRRRDARRDRS